MHFEIAVSWEDIAGRPMLRGVNEKLRGGCLAHEPLKLLMMS
jgi:hypothetical protein